MKINKLKKLIKEEIQKLQEQYASQLICNVCLEDAQLASSLGVETGLVSFSPGNSSADLVGFTGVYYGGEGESWMEDNYQDFPVFMCENQYPSEEAIETCNNIEIYSDLPSYESLVENCNIQQTIIEACDGGEMVNGYFITTLNNGWYYADGYTSGCYNESGTGYWLPYVSSPPYGPYEGLQCGGCGVYGYSNPELPYTLYGNVHADLINCNPPKEELPKFCCDFDAFNFQPEVGGYNVNQIIITNDPNNQCDNTLCEGCNDINLESEINSIEPNVGGIGPFCQKCTSNSWLGHPLEPYCECCPPPPKGMPPFSKKDPLKDKMQKLAGIKPEKK